MVLKEIPARDFEVLLNYIYTTRLEPKELPEDRIFGNSWSRAFLRIGECSVGLESPPSRKSLRPERLHRLRMSPESPWAFTSEGGLLFVDVPASMGNPRERWFLSPLGRSGLPGTLVRCILCRGDRDLQCCRGVVRKATLRIKCYFESCWNDATPSHRH